MDDENHSEEPIATTLRSVLPHFNRMFVYFIEGNEHVQKSTSLFEGTTIHGNGELTTIMPPKNYTNLQRTNTINFQRGTFIHI